MKHTIAILIMQIAFNALWAQDAHQDGSSFKIESHESINNQNAMDNETIDYLANSGDPLFSNLSLVNMPKRSYYISTGFGMSNFVNTSLKEDGWDIKSDYGYSIAFGYYQKVRSLMAVGIGVGVRSFANQISKETLLQEKSDQEPVDVNNPEEFLKSIHLFTPVEQSRITYVDVPVFIEFGNPNVDKVGYFLRLGLTFSVPVMDQFNGKGTYSVKGIYPQYGDLILEDIKPLGYVSDQKLFDSSHTYELNPFHISGVVSGGISMVLNTSWIFKAGISYVHGLTAITQQSYDEEIEIHQIHHLFQNNDAGTYARSFGLEIGLQYVLDFY